MEITGNSSDFTEDKFESAVYGHVLHPGELDFIIVRGHLAACAGNRRGAPQDALSVYPS
jgi:hypothetical protein